MLRAMRGTTHSVLLLAGALVILGSCAERAEAQHRPGGSGAATVRGVVRATTGEAIPYASVALLPAFAARFTDDSGAFLFTGVAPGTYHLVARQVGYTPHDTSIVVEASASVTVAVALEHFVVELSAITVVGEMARPGGVWRCTNPGAPDSAQDPEVAAVFDQLRENAQRYWLLADSYPAFYRLERRFGRHDRDWERLVVRWTDTVGLRTDTRWRYAPGHLLADVPLARGRTELQVNLPTLPDFVDPVFVQNHCFRLEGLDTIAGGRYVRLDFRAAERIADPDADGSAYLDPGTYLIRYAKVWLTRPERAATGLSSFQATVAFREILPKLVLPERISSVQFVYQGSQLVEFAEEQRMIDVSFLRALPKRQP
jgi:hypothetical protein